MFSKKGQTTTEYLTILAVVIIIALIVVGLMGWFPALGAGITEKQSKAYWKSTEPLAITDWDVDDTNISLVIMNMTTDKIEIEDITVAGTDLNPSDKNIEGGDSKIFSDTDVSCTTGELYSYDVIITYSVEKGLQNEKQTGKKPIVGTCS